MSDENQEKVVTSTDAFVRLQMAVEKLRKVRPELDEVSIHVVVKATQLLESLTDATQEEPMSGPAMAE